MRQRLHPIDSLMFPTKSSNSPWTTTGCFISRHPFTVSALLGILFWIYRSQVYSGDGDQLTRMVEGGIVFVQTELLSHAIFRLFYIALKPFGWDGLSVINLVSCIAGSLAVWVLLKFNKDYVGVNPWWALGLFASSGLFLFCSGHTEYYTIFLVTLFYYGYVSVGYLRGRFSSLHAALAFSLAAWMHLGILFVFPTILLLPALRGRWRDYSGIAGGLSLTAAAYLFRGYAQVFGIEVTGLSPSKNFIPLFVDPDGERFYLMFEWGHLVDYLYGWSMRSWIYWPAVVGSVAVVGWRSLFEKERVFLLLYTLGFTVFTVIWHPNLGIIQDWDLFAIEAVPCLLLLLTYLPILLQSRFLRTALAIPVVASLAIVYQQMAAEANFGNRAYGSVRIDLSEEIPCQLNMNGHLKELNGLVIREGVYDGRLRNIRHLRAHHFYVQVAPYSETRFSMQVGANYGKGSPAHDRGEKSTQMRELAEPTEENRLN